MKLTEKQEAILAFIQSELDRSGVIPTSREIQSHFGFASQTGAMNHLRALEKKGVISRKAGLARAVIVRDRKPTGLPELTILGAIPAGMSIEASAEAERVPFSPNLVGIQSTADTFALRVRGDSMEGAHILDGDLAILERRPPRDGDVVAALIDGEVTLKRLVVKSGRAHLQAENPDYPDLIPAHALEVQGVLVGVMRKVGGARGNGGKR